MPSKRASAPRGGSLSRETGLWGGLRVGDLVVVDSAPLIYLLEENALFAPTFEPLFVAHAEGRVAIAVSTITVAEVLVGPLKHGLDVLARRYEKAFEAFDVVPVTHGIGVTGARLRATSGLRLPDALLAATALEVGAVALVTHDRDFSKLHGLPVLSDG